METPKQFIATQIPAKITPKDKELMIDMIKSGTGADEFTLFWSKECGLTIGTARNNYFKLKSKLTIDNGTK